MALNIGRKMTDQDREKLNAAAQRFCDKWNIDTTGLDALDVAQYAADDATSIEQEREMRRDWESRVKRALGGYTAWGYGYVGHSQK